MKRLDEMFCMLCGVAPNAVNRSEFDDIISLLDSNGIDVFEDVIHICNDTGNQEAMYDYTLFVMRSVNLI